MAGDRHPAPREAADLEVARARKRARGLSTAGWLAVVAGMVLLVLVDSRLGLPVLLVGLIVAWAGATLRGSVERRRREAARRARKERDRQVNALPKPLRNRGRELAKVEDAAVLELVAVPGAADLAEDVRRLAASARAALAQVATIDAALGAGDPATLRRRAEAGGSSAAALRAQADSLDSLARRRATLDDAVEAAEAELGAIRVRATEARLAASAAPALDAEAGRLRERVAALARALDEVGPPPG